ncbi:MAG: hydrogenase maturation protease [Spirochaetales bacterium]|nr:hydrogenase maturation protease [Leptospiraceae bacterium]MCP5481529.1 hydrogenase maturation protease [Spirochaetales bacterium]MCP5484357.1 hydrogenase maturation protease [Spirochaetales bacterium]
MKTLVITIGNAFRRDDGAGPRVAQILQAERPTDLDLLEVRDDATQILDAWQGFESAVLVDAVQSGAAPGFVYRLAPLREALPANVLAGYSTHGISLPGVLELGRTLGQLPQQLLLIAIEGNDFGSGTELSPAVERSCRDVAAEICARVIERDFSPGFQFQAAEGSQHA